MRAHGDAAGVLDFWFGPPDAPHYGSARREWFVKDPAFDRRIEQRFATLIEAALAGALEAWDAPPRHRLARILLLDQFTRNVFRGSARAFAGDAQALDDALALISAGADRELQAVERVFAYLPLEHAESSDMQARSVALFEALADEHPALADNADYARRHRDVIARFGRFPHRNAALGRPSSEAEAAFLARPGSGF